MNTSIRGAQFPLLIAMTMLLSISPGWAATHRLSIIPLPRQSTLAEGSFTLTEQDSIWIETDALREIGHYLADLLQPATGMKLAVKQAGQSAENNRGGIALKIEPAHPSLGREGYTLVCNPQGVTITGAQPAGVFYGVQSLRQLLPVQIDSPRKVEGVAWTLPAVFIEDQPRFPWRGMLLDPARHFLPREFLYKYIDLIARFKFNRLHLHLTDDQGWRLEIKRYPQLTEVGARLPNFSGQKGDGWFYSQEDIKQLVAYAARRFVTIIPEIEMPGHSGASQTVFPELRCAIPHRSSLCAGHDQSYELMEGVLQEVAQLFPSPFIHIGGDECDKSSWKKCDRCQARIQQEKLKDVNELQSYFIRRIERFLNTQGKILVGWDEILEGGLAPNAVVQSWRGIQGGIQAAQAGHDVIMSPTSHCYFDYYQGPPESEPKAIGGHVPLETVYAFEPIPPGLSAAEAAHVIGLQGNLWGEYVTTTAHAEYMSFPRALALAEVGWSAPAPRDFKYFSDRLGLCHQRFDLMGVNYRQLNNSSAR